MNNENNIKNIIDSRLESVCVSGELEEKILSMNAASVKKRKKIKPFAVIAAVCLCTVLTVVPVLAATVPSFNALLSRISPEIAQFLQPIQLECEYDGIKMEVLAAMNDDESAIIYLTMQDLTGNRIDETLKLLNYKFSEPDAFNYITFNHEVVDYDEVTNTATIRLSANSAGSLNGKKITIGINSFLSGKTVSLGSNTVINLADYISEANTIELDLSKSSISYGGGKNNARFMKDNKITVLKPDELNIPIPGADFANISNIGIVDGLLHVQVHYTNRSDVICVEDYVNLYLTNGLERLNAEFQLSVGGIDENGSIYDKMLKDGNNIYVVHEYTEYIFDIDPASLSGYALTSDYATTFTGYTAGKWQNTFKVESVKQIKTAECNIDHGNLKINRVSISPIGITVYGTSERTYNRNMDVILYMADGTTLRYGAKLVKEVTGGDSSSSFTNTSESICSTYSYGGENGEQIIKFMPYLPLDVDSVISVSVNGIEVAFK